MNSPSPLIPQGSLLEQKNRSRSRVRLAFFCVVGVHLVGLMVLLMQGCKREQPQTLPTEDLSSQPLIDDSIPMPVDTNPPPTYVDTNPPAVSNYTADPVPPPSVPTGPVGATEYIVARGDSFSSIAKNFPGVTVKAIQEANPNVNPLRLQIGQKLIIPPPAAPTTANGTTPGTATSAESEGIYVVKSGDTLTSIARKHNTTINALRSVNNLSTDRIVVGQKLKLPPKQ